MSNIIEIPNGDVSADILDDGRIDTYITRFGASACDRFDSVDRARKYLRDVYCIDGDSLERLFSGLKPEKKPSVVMFDSIREFISHIGYRADDDDAGQDVDVYDDYDESLAICYCGAAEPLTPEGEKEFGDVLDSPVKVEYHSAAHYALVLINDAYEDDEELERMLGRIRRFFNGVAGYIADSLYSKWFVEV